MDKLPDLPKTPRKMDEITRAEWIAFSWKSFSEIGSTVMYYVCTGYRDISEATKAAKDFDLYHQQIFSLLYSYDPKKSIVEETD